MHVFATNAVCVFVYALDRCKPNFLGTQRLKNDRKVSIFSTSPIFPDVCDLFYRNIVRAWLDFWLLLMELWRVAATMIVSLVWLF